MEVQRRCGGARDRGGGAQVELSAVANGELVQLAVDGGGHCRWLGGDRRVGAAVEGGGCSREVVDVVGTAVKLT